MLSALGMQAIEYLAGERARHVMACQASHDTHSHDKLTASVTAVSERRSGFAEMSVVVESADAKCEVEQVVGVPVHHHAGHHCHDPAALLMDSSATASALNRRKIGTYILEFGITAHSILIGLTLGVTPAAQLVPLLVALVFHQFFEGVALGTRIAEITPANRKSRAMVLSLIFALTTPLGTAVGIGVRTVYVGTSSTALLVQGILDAVSAGILLYTAFVHLIAEELTNNEQFHSLRKWERFAAFISLWCGAGLMSLIGNWA